MEQLEELQFGVICRDEAGNVAGPTTVHFRKRQLSDLCANAAEIARKHMKIDSLKYMAAFDGQ